MRDELIVSLAVCRFFFSNKTHTHPFHTQVMPSYTCRKICIRILRLFGKVKQTVYLLCESRWCRYPFIMLFQDAPVSYPPTTLVSFISTNNVCYVKTIRITEEEEKKIHIIGKNAYNYNYHPIHCTLCIFSTITKQRVEKKSEMKFLAVSAALYFTDVHVLWLFFL